MLSESDIDFRIGLAELKRCRTWDGFIVGKKRKRFERLLHHGNAQVIELAKEMELEDQLRSEISAASKSRDRRLDLLTEAFQDWLGERDQRISEELWDQLAT